MKLAAFLAARGNGIGFVLLVLVLTLGVACGSVTGESGGARSNLILVEAGTGSLTTILATKDLRVGTQRVSFLLATSSALVKSPSASVTTRRLDGTGEVVETKIADFHLWPYKIRGAYSTELTFDQPGKWLLEVSVQDGEFAGSGRLELDIAEKSLVPDLGSAAPLSRTKTLGEIGDVRLLTTDFTPDLDLYQISIADAATSNQPAVIVFATPAFCTSPTCGPQVPGGPEPSPIYRGGGGMEAGSVAQLVQRVLDLCTRFRRPDSSAIRGLRDAGRVGGVLAAGSTRFWPVLMEDGYS